MCSSVGTVLVSHVPCHETQQPHLATSNTQHLFTNVACTSPNMQMVVQGTQCHLGSFGDPVSAAMCYDREAARAHGAAAVLNFPSSAGTVGQPLLLPGNGESGEEEPSAFPAGSPPAGNADGNPVPYRGPSVRRFKSSGFVHVLCRVCAASTLSAYGMSMFGAL